MQKLQYQDPRDLATEVLAEANLTDADFSGEPD